jgi:RHS repeat-associated protein
LRRSFWWNDDAELIAQSLMQGDQQIIRRTYEWDREGNLRRRCDDEKGHRFIFSLWYNEYSRITRAEETIESDSDRIVSYHEHWDGGSAADPVDGIVQLAHVTARFGANGDLQTRYSTGGGRPSSFQLTWDGFGRLAQVKDQNGLVSVYGYDALGRRVSKELNGRTISFGWSGVRMISQQNGKVVSTSNLLYYPNSFLPLATMAEGAASYFDNDRIGAPLSLVDREGRIVSRIRYSANGAAIDKPPSAVLPKLRFQGQYFDGETGFHYSLFRYYDPILGSFISKDPIGFGGGFDLYRPAPNWWRWADPLGLDALDCDYARAEAQRLADLLQGRGFTEGVAGVLVVKNQIIKAASTAAGGPALLDRKVLKILEAIPVDLRAPWHGGCAEPRCITNALRIMRPSELEDAAIASAKVRKPGHASHGLLEDPCDSCKQLLRPLVINW